MVLRTDDKLAQMRTGAEEGKRSEDCHETHCRKTTGREQMSQVTRMNAMNELKPKAQEALSDVYFVPPAGRGRGLYINKHNYVLDLRNSLKKRPSF